MLGWSVVSDSLQPRGLSPSRLLCPWDFPGKNTGAGCHFLLQGIFLIQGLKPRLLYLLHCRRILYSLSRQFACIQIPFSHQYTSHCIRPHFNESVHVTPWTVSHQGPLSMEILQARILEWVAMPFSRGIFPTQGSNPGLLHLIHRRRFFTTEPLGKTSFHLNYLLKDPVSK